MIRKVLLVILLFSFPALASGLISRPIFAPKVQAVEEPEPDPGVIGNTLVTDSNTRGANQIVYSSFTTTTPGQISYCHARIAGIASGSITIGVWDIDGNILAYFSGAAGTPTAWYGGALNTPIIIEAATSYHIGIVTDDTSWSMFKRTSVANHYRRRKDMTFTATPGNFDFTTGYTSDSESNALQIQCDDTEATP